MRVYPKLGIELLRFGMQPVEVENLFGKPDQIFVDPDDANHLIWQFNEPKLRLTFYQNESNRLAYIRSSNARLELSGTKLIDSKIETLINLIHPNTDDREFDEYFHFTCYFIEKLRLSLNVEYGRVRDIELGVPFLNEVEYDWPSSP